MLLFIQKYKSIVGGFCYVILIACPISLMAQTQPVVNNPIKNNGALIDAKEVGDPTKRNETNFNGTNQTSSSIQKNDLNNTGSGLRMSGYLIGEIIPKINYSKPIQLNEISSIKLIDVRPDKTKIGFFPIGADLKKSGIKIAAIQIKESPLKWANKAFFEPYISTDSNSKRQLVILLKKCWISHDANEVFTTSNNKLYSSIDIEIELFSLINNQYFPQKKIIETYKALYNNGQGYHLLFDSLINKIATTISNIAFQQKEDASNAIALFDFNEFYNQSIKKYQSIAKPLKGVYLTYEDFINRKVYCDSIELITTYNNAERVNIYATEIEPFKNGEPISSKLLWGYSDGKTVYINSGNGFFLKQKNAGNGIYYFEDLNSIAFDRIKKSTKTAIILGNSNYEIIKDFSRINPLSYQLDFYTGKLH